MSGLLDVLLAYPTVVFTGFLGVVMAYWLFVILGALDIDLFHADGALEGVDGAAKGALEGAAKGMFEAAGDAGAEAVGDVLAGDGALEGADGLDGVHAKGEAAAGLLSALNLRRAPVTVTFSIIVFMGWILSYFGVTYLSSNLGAILPSWLFSTLILVASILGSLPLASLATKPLEGLFRFHGAPKREDIIGREVRIRTGFTGGRIGQADVDDGGAGLIVDVRSDSGNLKRGDRALIIDFDREKEAFIVEAYDAMLEDEATAKLPHRERSDE